MTIAKVHMCGLRIQCSCNNAPVVLIQSQTPRFCLAQVALSQTTCWSSKRTTAIVMQQWTLTTVVLLDQMTNHHFKVFLKCWSSASVICVPCPQTSVMQHLGLSDRIYHYHASWKMSVKLTYEHDILACVQYKPAR